MNQRQYDLMKRKYERRVKVHPTSYRDGRRMQTDQLEPLPYAIFFRIRIFIAVMIFAFFVFLVKDVLAEEEEYMVFQAMQYNISDEYDISANGLKEYVIDTFSEITTQMGSQ
ncbi:MAG: hypothetical protein LUF92_09680 [Clostridiales bacterium]|nr:hypothetical protein [Clostridiales bacterium]